MVYVLASRESRVKSNDCYANEDKMSSQQKLLAKAGLRRDGSIRRHASPSASTISLPRSPLSDTFSTAHITNLAKKGIRNILHTRAKSDDHTKLIVASKGSTSYPMPSKDVGSSDADASIVAMPRRSHSVTSITQSEYEPPPKLPSLSQDMASMLPTDFFFSATPESMSEGCPTRPVSLQHSDTIVAFPKGGSSKNARLQKILADKDLENIFIDASSLPSTALSTAKSTGDSMVPSSASSIGIFAPKSPEETSYRLSTALPPLPPSASELSFTGRSIVDETESQATSKPVSEGDKNDKKITEDLGPDQLSYLRSWPTAAYKPGDIKTDHTFGLYAIPFITAMDVLCQSTAVNDEQVVDDMIDYFATLGLEPVVNTIDMFWRASDILTPITSPVKASARGQETSSKRASRHSPVLKAGHLGVSSPNSSQPSPYPDSQAASTRPLDLKRFSAGQQSMGSDDRPTSSWDSQRSSSHHGHSPGTTHAATAHLPVPATSHPSQPLLQVGSMPQLQHHHFLSEGYDLVHRKGRSPHRAVDSFESSATGNHGGHRMIRDRFSIRKILSRHNVPG